MTTPLPAMLSAMLWLPALLQAASPATPPTEGSPIGAIPRQTLPASGCAAYLWTAGEHHALVAMVGASPAQLRMAIDGRVVDLPRAEGASTGPAASAGASFGLPAAAHYRQGEVDVLLDMTIATDPSLTRGGTVPGATLTLSRNGADTLVVPVAGLIGCAA